MTCVVIGAAWNVAGRASVADARSFQLILDSGATRTVFGKEWVTSRFPQEPSASLPSSVPSMRRFRFVNELVFPVLCTITAVGWSMAVSKQNISARIPIAITMDVVGLSLSLLLS